MTTRMTPPSICKVRGEIDWNDPRVRRRFSRLDQIVQTTASSVVVTDVNGVTVWVNEGFTRLTGYCLEEALGRTPGQLLQGPETNRAEAARVGAALRARQSVSAELINYTKDGRRFWLGMKIEPLFADNGELDGFVALESDITSRHEEKLAMERLTRRFNLATRAARVGVFERDANWEIVWWNEMMWEILGQDPEKFKPTNESWQRLIHPDDRERVLKQMGELLESREITNLRYRVIGSDGEIRHILSICAPADPNNGARARIAGVSLDRTERFHADQREQALQQQLRESAHQAGMAEIATGVLHNVGNLLNSLGIATTTARRELKSLRLEQLEQTAALVRSNRDTLASFLTGDERGRHLPDYLPALSAQIASGSSAIQSELETIDRLLQHLREIVSAQQQVARVGGRCESIRVEELIETALLVQASELAQIEVVREYEELPLVMTDRHKLLQILVNLISNARDAVRAGASDRRRIVVNLASDGQQVCVTIEDSGIGMPEEVLSQIWRFGFTTKEKGHGFGLHNSANAAREIGATLTAFSDGIGHGSRFVLQIPIDNPEPMLSGVAA